jgi:hypothetical protein
MHPSEFHCIFLKKTRRKQKLTVTAAYPIHCKFSLSSQNPFRLLFEYYLSTLALAKRSVGKNKRLTLHEALKLIV